MPPTARRIEIFAPFGEAFEITKKILFQPFDLGKWFVIGFAAWLATFFGGGGSYSYRHPFDKGQWNFRWHEYSNAQWNVHDHPLWLYPVLAIGGIFFLAFVVLFIWLNSRGRFMFTDCIVRNRGAIVAPWREYRTEGNRFFVFQLLFTLCAMFLFGCLALGFAIFPHSFAVVTLPLGIFFVIAAVIVMIVLGAVIHFMVPVMYRRRCTATEAFGAVWSLVLENLGVFILFFLFLLVLYIAAAMIGCLAGCLTCCIAALPYIGTVILLPVVMTLFTFSLTFLRQFGDSYDAWAVVRPIEPPPPQVPPMQEPLPPPA
jgi:hypothetical protein